MYIYIYVYSHGLTVVSILTCQELVCQDMHFKDKTNQYQQTAPCRDTCSDR